MKLSAKRELLLEFIYGQKIIYFLDIEDRRSLNWLEKEGFINFALKKPAIAVSVEVTKKGCEYLKSQPAFR